MPPTRPQSNPRKRPEKKIRILQIKKSQQKSLVSEYFYPLLGALLFLITAMLYALGYRFDEAAVIGLWVAGIIFVARQLLRFVRGEASDRKNQRKPGKPERPMASIPTKNYKAPEVPRVSKDFSPTPPAGDKRYPPPSPFIKPPNQK